MTAPQRWKRERDEHGAVAIMVAIMAVMLVSVAALTVDLGHAYVQKHNMQKRADFAALAGANADNLPKTASGGACDYGTAASAVDQAIIDVAAYLRENAPGNDPAPPATAPPIIDPADLVNCDLADGEAAYGMWKWNSVAAKYELTPNANQLSVITQPRQVDFGFATVMGFSNTNVSGEATVEIKTPLLKTLPFYAKDGCNYGSQTISQPTPGNAAASILLSHSGETNAARLTGPLITNPASGDPASVPLNAASPDDSLVINADAGTLAGVTDIGFFLSGTVTDGPEPVTVDSTGFNPPVAGQITIPHLPSGVTSVEAAWYVRVKIGGQWSPVTTGSGNNQVLRALPLLVGAPDLTCGQGPDSGNFGTIDVPPTPNPSDVNGNTEPIAYNIINGLTSGLAPFPQHQLLPPGYLCTSSSTPGAKFWNADGTNCVKTSPGMDSNAAEMGFITGFDSYDKGLLEKDATDSATQCPFNYPAGTSHLTTVRGRTINNDVLSCYFMNDGVTVSAVSSPAYAGPVVIDQSIYNSPRFVQVPVLKFPTHGSSERYQILDFRPGFIADQAPSATRVTGAASPTANCTIANGNNVTATCNGIAYRQGQLNSVNVIFLNPKALPNPPLDPNGKYIPYVGSGPKVPMLVN